MYQKISELYHHVFDTPEVRILSDPAIGSHVIDELHQKWDFLVQSNRDLVGFYFILTFLGIPNQE
jgi:hypothetical protein